MYRTPYSIRLSSAVLAVVFGLGLVATAGGALREENQLPFANMQLVKLEAVVIKPNASIGFAAACEQTPKAAL